MGLRGHGTSRGFYFFLSKRKGKSSIGDRSFLNTTE